MVSKAHTKCGRKFAPSCSYVHIVKLRYQRSLIMGDEAEDLKAVVSKQGLALQALQQAAAGAKERHKSSDAELLEMTAALLETSRKSEAQQKSGREQRLPTADTAGKDTVSPSLDRSDDGTGSRKKERGDAAGDDPNGGQLGGREQDWGAGPSGELSITAAEGFRSRPFLGQPKMAIPVLKGRDNSDIFSKQMRVYAKLHGFETVFDNDPYVKVGPDGMISNPSWPREYRTRRTKGHLWPGCFSHKPYCQMLTKQLSNVVRLPGDVENWYKIGTTPQPMPKRECACGNSLTLKSGWKTTL